MKRNKKLTTLNNKGFSHVEMILTVIVVATLVVVGVFVFNRDKTNNTVHAGAYSQEGSLPAMYALSCYDSSTDTVDASNPFINPGTYSVASSLPAYVTNNSIPATVAPLAMNDTYTSETQGLSAAPVLLYAEPTDSLLIGLAVRQSSSSAVTDITSSAVSATRLAPCISKVVVSWYTGYGYEIGSITHGLSESATLSKSKSTESGPTNNPYYSSFSDQLTVTNTNKTAGGFYLIRQPASTNSSNTYGLYVSNNGSTNPELSATLPAKGSTYLDAFALAKLSPFSASGQYRMKLLLNGKYVNGPLLNYSITLTK